MLTAPNAEDILKDSMLLDNNKNPLHSVWLTFDELKLLDGKCRTEIQTLIDKEKLVNSVGLNLPFMNEAITSALKTGKLTFYGSGDCCKECFDKHKVMETLIDYVLSKDLKIEIQKNEYKKTKYIKDDIRICFACKKEIQESKMGLLPALMGGEYHGQCPECGAKSVPFGQTHEITSKFIMILTSELQ